MEDYIKCELIHGGSPRHLNTLKKNQLLYCCCTAHISTHAIHCYCCFNCTGSVSVPASFWINLHFHRGLGNIVQENTTADILVEIQPQPPLVTVNQVIVDWERELHKQLAEPCTAPRHSLWYNSST